MRCKMGLAGREVLEDAPKKLTRPQVARRWPPDAEAPAATTLWRWLERAVAQGLILREGTGRKSDPYCYWLPGQEVKWQRPRWEEEVTRLIERMSESAAPPAGGPPSPSLGGPG
jgi:hypothetical protein